MLRTLVIGTVLALSACQGRSAPASGGPGAGSGSGSAPAGPQVAVIVDGAPPVTLAITGARPLAELLPAAAQDPASWTRLEAQATGRRFLDLDHPARTYPDGTLRVFLDARGRPALGVFRPVREGLPPEVARIAAQPSPQLVDVTEIRVRTQAAEEVGGAAFVLALPGQPDATLTSADLAALGEPAQGKGGAEGDGQGKRRGWPLAKVIALRGPAPAIGTVTIEDRDGAATPIPGAALAAPGAAHLLRVNKRGQWVFEAWAAGGEAPTLKIGDVARIRVAAP